MKRKDLEIIFSQNIEGFRDPIIDLEQYQTPARTAANVLHRADQMGDIYDKNIIDLCAGTGILGLGASILGAKSVTCIEIDKMAIDILYKNARNLELDINVEEANVLEYKSQLRFDTALLNPPFGIQQKKWRDIDFLIKAHELASIVYSIHDGSDANLEKLPTILKKLNIELLESYLDEFPIGKSYYFHSKRNYTIKVLVIKSKIKDIELL